MLMEVLSYYFLKEEILIRTRLVRYCLEIVAGDWFLMKDL